MNYKIEPTKVSFNTSDIEGVNMTVGDNMRDEGCRSHR
jgi:hypothetical protein